MEDLKQPELKEERKKPGPKPKEAVSVIDELIPKEKEYYRDEDMADHPLETYEDYIHYNEMIKKIRSRTRKSTLPVKYCPHNLVNCVRVKMTRTKNRGKPINLNLRDSKNWLHLVGSYKDGEEATIPEVFVDQINALAEPKYKQTKLGDGAYITELDYMDNKYNCQIVMNKK